MRSIGSHTIGIIVLWSTFASCLFLDSSMPTQPLPSPYVCIIVLHTRSTHTRYQCSCAKMCVHAYVPTTLFYRFNQLQRTVATLFLYSVELSFISNHFSTNRSLRNSLPSVTKEYLIRKQDISLFVSPRFHFFVSIQQLSSWPAPYYNLFACV